MNANVALRMLIFTYWTRAVWLVTRRAPPLLAQFIERLLRGILFRFATTRSLTARGLR